MKLPSFVKRSSKTRSPWRRTIVLIAVLVLIAIIPGVYFALRNPDSAKAAVWYNSAWAYRKQVNLTSISSSQTDYQTKITIDTATLITANKMQSACQDVRFADANGKLLPYWIETGTNACNTATTIIWVKVPSVPTTGATIYFYYGNSNAADAQNGDNVFEFFDDFSTTLNTTKWTATGAHSNSAGAETITTGAIYSNSTVVNSTQNRIFEYKAKWAATAVQYSGIATSNTNSIAGSNANSNKMAMLMSNTATNIHQIAFAADGSTASYNVTSGTDQFTPTANTYYYLGYIYDGTNLRYQQNRTQTNAYATSVQYAPFMIFGFFPGSAAGVTDVTDQTIDFVDVRKYVSTEPTATFATEEVSTTPLVNYRFDEGYGTTTNDNTLNSNTGTLGGTTVPVWQTEDMCISGKCLYYDGATSKVTGSKIAKNVQSIGFWIRPNTIITQGIMNLDGGTHKVSLNGSGVVTATGFSSPTYYVNGLATTTPTLVQNRWNYVEITTATPFNTTASFTIGTDGTNFIKGFIDEVKFYGYSRSADQAKVDFVQGLSASGLGTAEGVQPATPLSNGLIGYWKMNEASWTVNCSTLSVLDASGNAKHGRACPNTTGPAGGTAGKYGNGGFFDGANDYVEVTDAGTTDPLRMGGTKELTMSGWVNIANLADSSEQFIVSKYTFASNSGYALAVKSDGSIEVKLNGSLYAPTTATGVIAAGSWYHIAATLTDGKTVKVYVNGVLNSTFTISTAGTTITADTNSLVIGGASDAAGNTLYTLSGTIDETRVYNRALSATEIFQLYSFSAGPAAYWPLNEHTGQNVFDTSGNNFTAGILGTTTAVQNTDPLWVQGKYGSGLAFDGGAKDTQVLLGDDDNTDVNATGSITVGAWVRVLGGSSFNNDSYIVDKINSGSNAGWSFTIAGTNGTCSTGGQICFTVQDGTNAYTTHTTSVIADTNWHYVETVFDRSAEANTAIYLDGVSQPLTHSGTFTSIGSMASTTVICMGIDSSGLNCGSLGEFNGTIDDLRIYNYARTANQVGLDMRGTAPNQVSNLGTGSGAGLAPGTKPSSAIIDWKMDELSGLTVNNTGSGGSTLNGTGTGIVWAGPSSCKVNGCVNIDTNTDKISAGDVAFTDSLGQMTISMWINPTSLSATSEILGKYNDATQNSFLIATAGSSSEIVVVIASSITDNLTNYYTTTNLGLTAGTWQKVTIVFDGSQPAANRVKVYKNGGIVSGTVTGTISATLPTTGSANLILGNTDNTSFTALLAKYDEVKIYPVALTQDQVNTDYNSGLGMSFGVGGISESANDVNGGGGNPPVGYWRMDEHTGTTSTFDSSGNGYTGTLVSSPTWVAGKIGSALNFNGGTQQVTTTYAAAMGDFTVCGWFKYTGGPSGTGYGRIADKTYDNGWWLGRNNQVANQWGGGVKETTGGFGIFVTLTDGQWNYICSERSGSTHYIIGNGGAVINSNTVTSAATNTAVVRLGNDGNGASGFTGIIDEVKLYDYARSLPQIAYDYNRGMPIGWWKADECSGTTLNDASGNSNTGTITIGGTGVSSVGDCNTASTAWGNGATGKFNSSIAFDGADDKASLGRVTATDTVSQLTWSYWVKPDALTASKVMFAKGNALSATDEGWAFSTYASDPTAVSILVSSNLTDLSTGAFTSGGILSVGNWTHVVAVYDGTQSGNGNRLKMYANGKLLNISYAGTIPASLTTTTATNVTLGATSDNTAYFDGEMDDVRIYNYALSANQVNKLFNNGLSIRYAPVTGNP